MSNKYFFCSQHGLSPNKNIAQPPGINFKIIVVSFLIISVVALLGTFSGSGRQAFASGTLLLDRPFYDGISADVTITALGPRCDQTVGVDSVFVDLTSVDKDSGFVDKVESIELVETGAATGICLNPTPIALSLGGTPDTGDGILTVVQNGEIGANEVGTVFIGFEASALISPAIRIDVVDCEKIIDNSSCSDPRWDLDRTILFGRTTPGLEVSVDWGDDQTSTASIEGNDVDGYFFQGYTGAANHVYDQSHTGENQIVATLKDFCIEPDCDPIPVAESPASSVDVQKHATKVTLAGASGVPVNSDFSDGGVITDDEPEVNSQQLQDKTISIYDGSLATKILPDTTSEPVIFSAGVEVALCPPADCKGDGIISFDSPPANMLRMQIDNTVTLPANTDAVRMCVQEMGTDLFEVEVTKGDLNTFTKKSFGAGDDLSIFELYSPLGIKQIRISNITDEDGNPVPAGRTVNITCFETFNTTGIPQEQRKFGFDGVPFGLALGDLTLEPGTFFSTGPAPATVEFDLSAIARFGGDGAYLPDDSDPFTYNTIAQTLPGSFLGTGGEGTLVLTGDAGVGVTKLDCGYPVATYDTDGDGLCNTWEKSFTSGGGIKFSGTTYKLFESDPALPASPTIPDIYVEIDTMAGHALDLTTVRQPIVDAFAVKGIRLHLIQDETNLVHVDLLNVWSDPGGNNGNINDDFDSIKNFHFGRPSVQERPAGSTLATSNLLKAKANAYHYLLVAHNMSVCPGSPSGIAEKPGNDFIVTLGCNFGPYMADGITPDTSKHRTGTANELKGTIMHELGHNLNLAHGGGDEINCKANYPSVMSYTKQFDIYAGWTLDYSGISKAPNGKFLGNLNEDGLNENGGILLNDGVSLYPAPSPTIVYYSNGVARTAGVTGTIDWTGTGSPYANGVVQNINTFPRLVGCDVPGADPTTMLNGYNDWSHLGYNFRTLALGLDGVHPRPEQLPAEQRADMVVQQKILANQYVILSPLKENGPNVFKIDTKAKSSTIPVKIQIFDENGKPLDGGANAILRYSKDLVTNPEVPAKSASAVPGDSLFRWDGKTKSLIFNWDIKGLSPGTYYLKVYRNFSLTNQSLLDKNSDGVTVTVQLT